MTIMTNKYMYVKRKADKFMSLMREHYDKIETGDAIRKALQYRSKLCLDNESFVLFVEMIVNDILHENVKNLMNDNKELNEYIGGLEDKIKGLEDTIDEIGHLFIKKFAITI